MNHNNTPATLHLPSIDEYTVPSVASQLFSWMRTFWTKLYRDKAFLKNLQGSRALRYAQLYLDLLENVQALDHSTVPVFHRERWYPIIIRKNRRNEADAALLRLGDGAVLADGTQQGYDKQIDIGAYTDKSDTVSYSLNEPAVDIVSCVTDSIAKPTIVLNKGSDFNIVRQSIVISKEKDPFADNSGFVRFETYDEDRKETTEEIVLWGCDTLVDKDLVFKHAGYAVGLRAESSEQYSKIVKAVWDATNDGLNPMHLRMVLSSLCGVPCIIEDKETVQTIYSCDNMLHVITDKNVYTLGGDATLRECVKGGNTLSCGDFLDTSVRIYPFISSVDDVPRKTEFSTDQFKEDVSSVSIPLAILRGPLNTGFYAGWDEKDVYCAGFDSHGNPKLMFDLGTGDPANEREYWDSVWNSAESAGMSMEDCFEGIKSANIHEGSVCGKVIPLRFFMKNLIGANTIFVFVDTGKIAEDAPLYDPNFYQALRKLVPDYVRLYFVEHGAAVDDLVDEDTQDSDSDVKLSLTCEYDDQDDYFEEQDDYLENFKWTRKCRRRAEDDED